MAAGFKMAAVRKWPPKIKVCRILLKMGYLGKSGIADHESENEIFFRLSGFSANGGQNCKIAAILSAASRENRSTVSKLNLPQKWTSMWRSVIMFRIFQDGRHF